MAFNYSSGDDYTPSVQHGNLSPHENYDRDIGQPMVGRLATMNHDGQSPRSPLGYRPGSLGYDQNMYPTTVALTKTSPEHFSDDDDDSNEPIIKKLFTGEKVS